MSALEADPITPQSRDRPALFALSGASHGLKRLLQREWPTEKDADAVGARMTIADLIREFEEQAEVCKSLAGQFGIGSRQRAEAYAREETWKQAADRLRLLDPKDR